MKSNWKLYLCIALAAIILLPAVTFAGEVEKLREELDKLSQKVGVLEKEKDAETGWADWVVTGYADTGYRDSQNDTASFVFGRFSPIFLFQLGDNILFEGELEIELEDGETKVDLEYAQLDWSLHDNVTLVLGKFLSPFNIFIERLHPTWINKLPTMPIMYQHHGGFLPTSELGAQVRGGINVGPKSKVEYAVYITNGPTLVTAGHEAGGLEFGSNFEDNNGNKAVGFRVNFLPIPHFDFGVSYLHASVDNSARDDADLVGIFGSAQYKNLDLKFEWAHVRQDLSFASISTFTSTEPGETDAEFQNEFLGEFVDAGGSPLERDGLYIQGAYMFTDIPFPESLTFLNKLELIARYDYTDLPGRSEDQHAVTIGLNYWLRPNFVFKTAYETSNETPEVNDDVFLFQVAYGF